MKPFHFQRDTFDQRFVVEGREFAHAHAVYACARDHHGFTGSPDLIARRLKHGVDTWSELIKPGMHSPGHTKASIERLRAHEERSRNEVAEAIAAVERRKKEMRRC